MRKLSGIRVNNINRLHLDIVIRISFDKNLNFLKVQVAKYWSNKNHLISSQFTEYVQNQVLYISNTAGNMQIIFIPSSFCMHNFKLKTEAIID